MTTKQILTELKSMGRPELKYLINPFYIGFIIPYFYELIKIINVITNKI